MGKVMIAISDLLGRLIFLGYGSCIPSLRVWLDFMEKRRMKSMNNRNTILLLSAVLIAAALSGCVQETSEIGAQDTAPPGGGL